MFKSKCAKNCTWDIVCDQQMVAAVTGWTQQNSWYLIATDSQKRQFRVVHPDIAVHRYRWAQKPIRQVLSPDE